MATSEEIEEGAAPLTLAAQLLSIEALEDLGDGFTTRSFARHLGVKETAIRRLRQGKRVRPATAMKFVRYFELSSVNELYSPPRS